MTGATWRSAFVAALFAVHPLHVQSVAWAAERKDVLSAFFFMLTLLAYARYAGHAGGHVEAAQLPIVSLHIGNFQFPVRPAVLRPRVASVRPGPDEQADAGDRAIRAAVARLLATGAVSELGQHTPDHGPRTARKSQIVNRTLLEKLPFLALSAASCVVTVWAQSRGGAVVPVAVLTFGQRVANAVVAYAGYLGKMLWPAKLAVLYPLAGDVPVGTLLLSAGVLAAITGWAVWSWRTRPYLAVGWFWYLGMLVPVIGLVQVGMQRMADRYTYLPLIGVFVMVTWELAERLGKSQQGRRALGLGAALVLAACVAATSRELGYWKDSEQLFARALEVAPSNYIALDNYGRALLKEQKLAEAAQAFAAAVALRPDLDASRCGLGTALQEQGKYEQAADQFSDVLKLQPDNFVALMQLGLVRGRQGKLDEAAGLLSHALRLRPDDAGAHNNLGSVLLLQGKNAEAARQFEETVRLKPNHTGALNNLALACRRLGRTDEAIAHYREALRLQPDSVESLNNLAWTLAAYPDARFRNGTEAVALATRACELTRYGNPIALATLAAAYAEAGQFRVAISFVEQAQESRPGRLPCPGRSPERHARGLTAQAGPTAASRRD